MALIKNEENARHFIEWARKNGWHDDFIAGMAGNIITETAHSFESDEVQHSYINNGMVKSKEDYVRRANADQETVTKDNKKYYFVNDAVGFGLCMWTSSGRKVNMMNFMHQYFYPIEDFIGQLEWIKTEISTTGYANVRKALANKWSLEDCTRVICEEYERPRSMQTEQKEQAIQNRIEWARQFKKEYMEEKEMSYSNSSLVDYVKISPNKHSPRNHKIDTITIHCVVGQVTVQRLGEIFEKPSRNASCNYGIGFDGKIALIVDEKDRSWCSSSPDNDHRAITIEVASDTTAPYAITDAAMNALIKLCADICKRNNIPKFLWKGDKSLIGKVDQQNMTVHRWFAAKSCPGDYIYNRLGWIADEVNKLLGIAPEAKYTTEIKHTVVKGDTLSKIANKYGVSWPEIMNWNPIIKDANKLSVGWVLTIKVPTDNIPKTYTVVSGDTLSKIGKLTGVPWKKIAELNNINFPYIIRKGQVLKLS